MKIDGIMFHRHHILPSGCGMATSVIVDQIDVFDEQVQILLHDRELLVKGPTVAIVHPPELRAAEMCIDRDVVSVTFKGAPEWAELGASLPGGVEQRVVHETAGKSRTFELRRSSGSEASFVEQPRRLV